MALERANHLGLAGLESILASPVFLGFLPDAGEETRPSFKMMAMRGRRALGTPGLGWRQSTITRDTSFHVVCGLRLSLVPNYWGTALRLSRSHHPSPCNYGQLGILGSRRSVSRR